MASEVISLYVYDLHGHRTDGNIDYVDFFNRLASIPATQRSYSRPRNEQVIAIPEILVEGTVFSLRFISGRPGNLPIFYDAQSGAERQAQPRPGELTAETSWYIIDAANRLVVQERRRPGVPLGDATRALTAIARNMGLVDNPSFTFHPIISDTFAEEVDDLGRIREAEMSLARPNMSFRDAANSLVSESAALSNAGSIIVGAQARRGESLEKDAGIVAEIKEMVATPRSALRRASVTGTRAGESRERSVSTRQHARREDVDVPDGTNPEQRVELVRSSSTELVYRISAARAEVAERSSVPDAVES